MFFFFFSKNRGREAYRYKHYKNAGDHFLDIMCSFDELIRGAALEAGVNTFSSVQTCWFWELGAAVSHPLQSLGL